MGLRWHLTELLDQRQLAWADLESALPDPIPPDWLGGTPPDALGPADLAALCEVLACQPGDLLTFESDDPAEQAAQNLAADLFYQSFLAHQAMLDEGE